MQQYFSFWVVHWPLFLQEQLFILDSVIKTNSEKSLGKVFGVRGKEVTLRPTPEAEVLNMRFVEAFIGYERPGSVLEDAQQPQAMEDLKKWG